MCAMICDGSCQSSVGSAVPGPGDVLVVVLKGAWWVTRKAVAPALAASMVVATLFVAGTALTPRGRQNRVASGATWLWPGAKVAEARARLHWYAWPGWQRTVVRLLAVGIAVGTWLAPFVMLVVAAVLVVSVALAVSTRKVGQQRAVGPRKVRSSVVGAQDQMALAASPASKANAWISMLRKVRV